MTRIDPWKALGCGLMTASAASVIGALAVIVRLAVSR
jgi:hypothetical protein